ncbi:hypothetical protein GCM10010377_81630 [Streptomyces viridiviolaceus]|uniref:Uncharacterized protein n=1 Tax=Streptomyces viridiviolaceus TaxID=68282 RepID=A0ABW2EI87_9ACTN|nr:hypothetical protein [Streptomyces viridiviolaceus]GHB79268.1 hypothetical protein GCM10010377_81630 [Streptomyces viridiviolaceus]
MVQNAEVPVKTLDRSLANCGSVSPARGCRTCALRHGGRPADPVGCAGASARLDDYTDDDVFDYGVD